MIDCLVDFPIYEENISFKGLVIETDTRDDGYEDKLLKKLK